ncbi:uncharacterized protein LOC125950856 [Anopheles darlingi]|uniref:uncharacterized protein LOC125950856 n=1 Tax=Anopheles darlingi TaxID=43151 RepID=UPI00210065FD|nr:uncharacterized protein LOC125950856 [Anopheles darlingi]
MKCFVVLFVGACLLALVSARPEGYNYYTPHGSSGGVGSSGTATSSASLVFSSGSSGASQGSSSSAHSIEDCEEPALHTNEHLNTHVEYFAPQAEHHSQSSLFQGATLGRQHEFPSHAQHGHHHYEAPKVHYVQQPVIKEEIHKHVYVHVAPEEKEEIHQKVVLPTYTKQKHYKIIFIKAPAPPTPSKVVLPQQPVNEEKTLVYVLHKKPELEQEIVVPPPAKAKTHKPEVYFIKYKTEKKLQHHEEEQHHHHESHHESFASSFGGSSTASSVGYEVSDLTGYSGGVVSTSFAPIVVSEGAYQYSTTAAPVQLNKVVAAIPSTPYVSSTARAVTGNFGSQDINVSNVGLSGFSTGSRAASSSSSLSSSSSSSSSTSSSSRGRQRGGKKPCGGCSKKTSGQLNVGGTLDAFVSNVF